MLCDWAFSHSKVSKVFAETEKYNIASQRVLQKCGMKMFKEIGTSFYWIIEKNNL